MILFISLRELQRGREAENLYPSPHQQATSTVQTGSSIITFTICLVPIMQLVVDDGIYVLIFLVRLWVRD